MMFDVGLRFNIRSAYFFRVHDTILTKFVIKAQEEGKHIFSVIPLFMKKEETVDKDSVNKDVVDPIDDKTMIASQGM